jgi:cytochrome b
MGLRDFNRTMLLPMRVWDAPTRLFHWVLVALVLLSYVSVQAGWMRVHVSSGALVLTLLLFRLAWGFVGSETARFSHFLGNPARGLAHLARFRQRGLDTQVGHNEAGGWMVLLMLVLLAVQVVSGLFNTDGHGAAGPLAKYASDRATSIAGAVHAANFTLLAAVVGLHVLAILAYALVKKHDLVRPMVTGMKRLPATTRQPRMASPVLAAVLAGLAGAAVWLLATRL